MRLLYFLFLTVLLCIYSTNGIAQILDASSQSTLPDFSKSPGSPEVASLGKYGEIPVGLRTGTLSYSIPIYEIDLKELTVPISIDYHSSGIKVNELSSSVGLGWVLNAGGVITAEINGLNDLNSNGWKTGQFTIPQNPGLPFKLQGWDPYCLTDCWQTDVHQQKLEQATEGTLDSEPDLYFFNFLGKNGKFVFDTAGVALPIPFNKMKFQVGTSGAQITDENGNIFEFLAVESSITSSMDYGRPGLSNSSNGFSFFLSKITTPFGEIINFIYDNVSFSYISGRTETRYSFPLNQVNCSVNRPTSFHSISTSSIVQPRLKEINSNKGHKVIFSYTTTRQDLPGISSLNNIKIYKGLNPFIVNFNLYQSYFGNLTSTDPDSKRLKLDSIKTDYQPAYKFSYISPDLVPHRLSLSQDHWGFFNNSGNRTLLPIDISNGFLSGGNRNVNEIFSTVGVLKKIVYPTGGYTEIEYESNEIYSGSANSKVGGLRVKKTTDFSWDSPPVVTDYEYIVDNISNRSSGVSFFTPNYTYSHFWENQNLDNNVLNDCQCTAQTSYPISQVGLGSVGGVSYGIVTVKKGGGNLMGKTVYFFQGNATYSGNYSYPFGPVIANDWALNSPTTVQEFKFENGNWVIDSQIENIFKDSFGLSPSQLALPNERYVRGVKLAKVKNGIVQQFGCGSCAPPRGPEYTANFYVYFSSWYYIKEKRETIYKNGVPYSIVKKYFYDNPSHGFNTREVISNVSSNSLDSTIVFKKYPLDYLSTVNSAISKMAELNVISKPIEIQELNKTGSETFLVGGLVSLPVLFSNRPFQSLYYRLEGSIPINLSTLAFPKSAGKFSSIFPTNSNPYVLNLELKNFDSMGNILDIEKNGGLTKESLLWDHNKAFLVSKVIGASSSQFAFSSFETTEKGGWVYFGSTLTTNPKTGFRCYNLTTGNITRSIPDASASNKYKLSFWARRSSGTGSWNFLGINETLGVDWKLIEREVSSTSLVISGVDILIDELRLHPLNSLMESFNYNPHLGLLSVSDPRNVIVYFVYDQFGRHKGSRNSVGEYLDYYDYRYFNGN